MQSLVLPRSPLTFSHLGHLGCDSPSINSFNSLDLSSLAPLSRSVYPEPYSPPSPSSGFMSSPSTAPESFWPPIAASPGVIPHRPTPTPIPTRRTKAHVASACVNCKKKHLGCDSQRPCRRCVLAGKAVSSFLLFKSYETLANYIRLHVPM